MRGSKPLKNPEETGSDWSGFERRRRRKVAARARPGCSRRLKMHCSREAKQTSPGLPFSSARLKEGGKTDFDRERRAARLGRLGRFGRAERERVGPKSAQRLREGFKNFFQLK